MATTHAFNESFKHALLPQPWDLMEEWAGAPIPMVVNDATQITAINLDLFIGFDAEQQPGVSCAESSEEDVLFAILFYQDQLHP